MSIINFIKAMLPRVEKSTIEEDIRTTLKELDQSVLPMYLAGGQHFRTTPLRHKDSLQLQGMYYNERDLRAKGPNFIWDLAEDLNRMKMNLLFLQKKAEEILEADLLNEGLTIQKAQVVRAVGAISFMSRFSLDFLNHILSLEAIPKDAELVLAPSQKKHMTEGIRRFMKSLNDFCMDPKNFERLFTELPDVVVTSKNAASLAQVFKPRDLDPFAGQTVYGFSGNPIYHIRLVVTEWQAKRYNANKDKKKVLELKLLQLKSLQDGKPNPRLEQEITYLESRVEKLDRAMREVEEDLQGV